jgi:hypothetical protein
MGAEMTPDLAAIRERLTPVQGKPWKYEPEHPMFIGTTNALNIWHDTINLGRNATELVPHFNERTGEQSYRPSGRSLEQRARIKSLGVFLECCREDITTLLDLARQQAERIAELERRLGEQEPLEDGTVAV